MLRTANQPLRAAPGIRSQLGPTILRERGWSGCLPLAELVAAAGAAGWQVLHLDTAEQREWDDFESRHRAGHREWLLSNRDDPRAAEVRAREDEREREYLSAYRGVLGFAYLVLAR